MLLFPAIDLMSGQAVRLRQGRSQERTVFPGTPADWAVRWMEQGGDWLHVVDLDAAFTGEASNLEAVREIRAAITQPIELGGGMRSLQAIDRALATGINRIVIGTRAAESLEFVADAVLNFGGECIAVGIDAINGRVAVRGWTEESSLDALDLIKAVSDLGVGALIYTDIATDGMLAGPNLPALDAVLESTTLPVIASGGVSGHGDLDALAMRPRLHGAIIGRALYDGMVDLSVWKGSRPTA